MQGRPGIPVFLYAKRRLFIYSFSTPLENAPSPAQASSSKRRHVVDPAVFPTRLNSDDTYTTVHPRIKDKVDHALPRLPNPHQHCPRKEQQTYLTSCGRAMTNSWEELAPAEPTVPMTTKTILSKISPKGKNKPVWQENEAPGQECIQTSYCYLTHLPKGGDTNHNHNRYCVPVQSRHGYGWCRHPWVYV